MKSNLQTTNINRNNKELTASRVSNPLQYFHGHVNIEASIDTYRRGKVAAFFRIFFSIFKAIFPYFIPNNKFVEPFFTFKILT